MKMLRYAYSVVFFAVAGFILLPVVILSDEQTSRIIGLRLMKLVESINE